MAWILFPAVVLLLMIMVRWARELTFAILLLCSLSLAADILEKPDPELRARLLTAINSTDSFEDRFHAEVWLMDMSNRLQETIPNTKERLEILRVVHQESTRANLIPELVLALIQVESDFDRFAISTAGAQGLMQVMPFWLDEIGRQGDNLFNIRTNLRMGCTILRFYLDKANGDRNEALARYNGSYGKTWYPIRVYDALKTRWYR